MHTWFLTEQQGTAADGWLALALFGVVFALVVQRLSGARPSTALDFMLSGRRVGWVRGAFSIAATWIWAPALFVAAQQGYQNGWVGVFWFTVPNVLCLLLFAWFARRVRTFYPKGFTLSDLARSRYSPRVQRLYLVTLIGLAAASFAVQVLAGSAIVSSITGIPALWIGLALAVFALAYTMRSGLAGAIVTDWLQMVVIGIVGVGLSLAVSFTAGWGTVASGLGGLDGRHLNLFEGAGAAVFWSFGLSTTIGLMSGPFGDQSFWQRAWAVEARHVGRSFVLGASLFALVPLSMSLLGLAAAGAHVRTDDAQLINLDAVLHWLPAWTVVPFLLYIFSGLVSTMTSQLSSVSSLVGYDLAGPDGSLRAARASMVALAVVGVVLANVPGVTIVAMFIFYGTFRSVTLIPTVVMLVSRREPSRRRERYVFASIVVALIVGIPLSAWGNLASITALIVTGSLVAVGIPALALAVAALRDRATHTQSAALPSRSRTPDDAEAAVDC